jgi:peptidoglycan/LPS O-acetylase OafA/YrhL
MKTVSQTSSVAFQPRFQSLDVWRGIACLMVTVFHIAGDKRFITDAPAWLNKLLSFGWLGVPMFFVISGYCISATCDSTIRQKRNLRSFFYRRFRRIYPPYWICLLTTSILAIGGLTGPEIHSPLTLSAWSWLGNITLTETWLSQLRGLNYWGFVNNPSWTLCYEEQFYLVCGIGLFFSLRDSTRFFTTLGIITGLTLVSSFLNWSDLISLHGFFFDGYWIQFAAGILVYWGRLHGSAFTQRRILLGLIIATLLMALIRIAIPTILVDDRSRASFLDGTCFSFAFAILLMLTSRFDEDISRAWYLKPLFGCGTICYSLYLTHWPVISILQKYAYAPAPSTGKIYSHDAALSLAVSLVVGALFYWLVERRFLNKTAVASCPNSQTSLQCEVSERYQR